MNLEQLASSCQSILTQLPSFWWVIPILLGGTFALWGATSFLSILKTHHWKKQLAKKAIPTTKQLGSTCKKLHIPQSAFILTNHPTPLAITTGVINEKIVLSRQLIKILSQPELEAVLLHEDFHRTHFHPIAYFFLEALYRLAFFIPLLHDVVNHLQTYFEYQADQFAISKQQTNRYLRNALTKMMSYHVDKQFVVSLTGVNLDQRFSAITTGQPPRLHFKWQSLLYTSIILGSMAGAIHTQSSVQALTQQNNQKNDCDLVSCVRSCVTTQWSQKVLRQQPMSSPDYQFSSE